MAVGEAIFPAHEDDEKRDVSGRLRHTAKNQDEAGRDHDEYC